MAIDQIELGRRIRQARESCGMTQDEVAEKLGVSRPIVVQIEQGKRPVSGIELQTHVGDIHLRRDHRQAHRAHFFHRRIDKGEYDVEIVDH